MSATEFCLIALFSVNEGQFSTEHGLNSSCLSHSLHYLNDIVSLCSFVTQLMLGC